MHALPPLSSGQAALSSQPGKPAASNLPPATQKAAAAGAQLAASAPPVFYASPPPSAMALRLCRSMEFPAHNPVETKVLKEKEINAQEDDAAAIEKKMNSVPMEEIFPADFNLDIDTEEVEKALSSMKNVFKGLGGSKKAPPSAPIAITSQQRSQLHASIASLFNCDPRIVERLSLPLEAFLETSKDMPQEPEMILNISRKAMESCILPCLEALAPDSPFPIDFAFCNLEKNALVPLLKKICLAPNNPTIRISRDLTGAEKKVMD